MATTNTRPVTVTGSKGWFRQHKASGKAIMVAEDGGKIIGWLSVRPFFRRPAYDSTAKVLVYIAPGYRKKGVGSELLAKAVGQSPSIGVSVLVGYLLSHNVAARKLLESKGFEKWGYFPQVASINGMEHDVMVMGRKV